MTAFGPPGGAPPPPNQPPPPGGYGPPPSGPPPASGGFDPKSVNSLDWGILGAGVLSLIFSFFSFYSFIGKGAEIEQACQQIKALSTPLPASADAACNGVTTSAWNGFFGWFGVLLAVIGAGLVALALFAPQVSLPVPARLAGLGAFALATVSTLLALLVVPDYDGTGTTSSSDYDRMVDEGHGFSYWIVLLLVVVGLVLSFLRFQQTGGQLPGRGAAAGGAAPPPSAPPGYGPPPSSGYSPQSSPPPTSPPPTSPPPSSPPQGYPPPGPAGAPMPAPPPQAPSPQPPQAPPSAPPPPPPSPPQWSPPQ